MRLRPDTRLGLLILIGLVLRLIHFLRTPSVWHDEAALLINVIRLDFRELLGPLIHSEAAPPLFLWLERGMVLLFGDGIQSLRMLPLIAACLALVLFAGVVRRILPPLGAFWAVAFFAFSDRLLWHACEAKPYAVDSLIGVLILTGWWAGRNRSLNFRILCWVPVMPVFLWLSYPGCFLAGGVVLALLPEVYRTKSLRSWLALGVLSAVIGGSFLLLLAGPAGAQKDHAMVSCWVNHFPNWSKPASVPFWSIFSAMEVVRYNLMPFGQAMTFFIIVGAVQLYRTGQSSLVLLLLSPLVLTFVAACIHAYPFGGSRVMVFAAPALLLLLGASVEPVLEWCRLRSGYLVGGFALLLLLPLGQGVFRTVQPWTRADCNAAAEYVQANALPEDVLAFNHWEYEYYFRRESNQLWPLPQAGENLPRRTWVIVTGDRAEERQAVVSGSFPHWQELDRREFTRTLVVLLNRPEG